jgi:1,4-alpha-glucan branching enzyme
MTLLTDQDLHYFAEGTHSRLFERLGARIVDLDGRRGAYFAVWAPNARQVSVIGDFNGWAAGVNVLAAHPASGIWEGFVPGLEAGALYKFHIDSHFGGYSADKADPFGVLQETPPGTASVLWELAYDWDDGEWMRQRASTNWLTAPVSIYEVHLGSWRKVPEEGNRFLSYREIAPRLVEYVKQMGFTHVELMPVMEHPFYGSWGYQTSGYFAPTSRYGTPQDFMFLVDSLHQNGVGVILDWVPSHFPTDEHGLGYFDGTHLYEHADPRLGFHPDWNSYIFNYGRKEVQSFLLSSAQFWLEVYHADALRVDAVASMLYRNYSRADGAWIPNQHGGRENLEAIGFLRQLNDHVFRELPGIQTIAEESTAWPMVSKPSYLGGLGFGFKWDMGWMHDTLKYISQDPYFRKYHHHELTFRMIYAFTENFILSLSHDEVVHGKGSLIGKLPGDYWQKFANLRLLLSYMWAQPGKKLLFMGGEFGQWAEWNHDSSLDWALLNYPSHAQVRLLVGALNHLYRTERALHECEAAWQGFEWIDCHDAENNVISFQRKGTSVEDTVLVACNFSPVPRPNYRVGVPLRGFWREVLNTDATEYGGSGQGNFGGVAATPIPLHGRLHSITITLPPLGAVFFRWGGED